MKRRTKRMSQKKINTQTSTYDTWQYKYCETVVHHEYANLLALKGIDLVSKIQTILHDGGSMGGLMNAIEEMEDDNQNIDLLRVWVVVSRIEIEYLKKTIVNMQHAKTNEEKKQAIIDSVYTVFTFTYNIAMECIEVDG